MISDEIETNVTPLALIDMEVLLQFQFQPVIALAGQPLTGVPGGAVRALPITVSA